MMSNKVVIREVQESDLPTFFEQQLDPTAIRMAAFPSRTREAFFAHWTKIMAQDTGILRTVLFNGEVAGNVVYWEDHDEPKVGYWLGKEYWGKGIATAALLLFLNHVKVRPLYARVAKHNIASLRVLEKCGFIITGGDHFSGADGETVEEVVLRLGPKFARELAN